MFYPVGIRQWKRVISPVISCFRVLCLIHGLLHAHVYLGDVGAVGVNVEQKSCRQILWSVHYLILLATSLVGVPPKGFMDGRSVMNRARVLLICGYT